MKRSGLSVALLVLFALSLLAITLPFDVKASSSTSIDVKVEHVVDIRESGLIIVNDTVTLATLGDGVTLPEDYVLGFPFAYRSNLAYTFAYVTSDPSSTLELDLNAGMGRIGFYGINVNLPATVEKFTVVFVFSNSISFSVTQPEETQVVTYNASFPAYPSLPQLASEVRLKIITPTSLNYTRSSLENEGISFAKTTEDSRSVFSYIKSNLTEFSDQPAWFYAYKTGTAQILDFDEVERRIEILGDEQVAVSDSYRLVNKAGELGEIHLRLPAESYSVSAFDEFGIVPGSSVQTEQADLHTDVVVTLSLPHSEGDEVYILVQYMLPWKNHVTVGNFGEFHVSFSLSENTDWVIRKLTVSVFLPEGASLRSLSDSEGLINFQNTAFSSSLVFVYQNATPFHSLSFDLAYQRPIFWNSFRPAVWMGTFVFVVGALIGAWRVYRPSPSLPLTTAVTSVRPEDLKNFVTYYDEKRRLLKEAESLEAAARKGRMPRRQYKVRKMTTDGRLNSLSRDLAALSDKLRGAGARYTELMRQLEVAETELQGIEADISRTEVRYRRGEISAAAYHKLLEDSYRRRDRAQTTIDGVLLRLREEIT